jgi:hypothetical protein
MAVQTNHLFNMKRNHILLSLGVIAVLLLGACSRKVIEQKPASLSNKPVLDWGEAAYNAMGATSYQHSLLASRVFAMVHIAMHDAINAIEPKYEQYAYKQAAPGADVETAVAYAAYTVLTSSFPEKKAMLDSMLAVSMPDIEDGEAKAKGVEVGIAAGNAILTNRAGDGADLNPVVKIDASATPGVYNVVPPFDFVFAPHWKTMKLFGVNKHDQFRPGPPPALNSPEYKTGFDEVKEVGRLNSTTRTADQSFYARFWYEFSEAGWNRIARTVAADKKLNLVETARLMALVNMALADAYTTGWDAKFYYNFWRPYTAIRAAAKDGNDATAAESDWEPSMPTPPVQDYPSTHSALGNAAARVLIDLVGDNTTFTFSSPSSLPAGSSRTFNSFSAAANENADSRVMAGIHFRFSCEAGQKLGDQVGKYIVQNHLKKR